MAQNLSTNPALGANATGWSGGTRVSVTGFQRPNGYQGSGVNFFHDVAGLTPNSQLLVSFDHKLGGSASPKLTIVWETAGGAYIDFTDVNLGSLSSGVVRRLETLVTPPTNATNAEFQFKSFPSGSQVTAVYVEHRSDIVPYNDGESSGWQWDGAQYNSTSSEVPGPTVDAGADVTFWQAGTEFTRTATEDPNGQTITSREWRVISGPAEVDSVIETDASLAWTPVTPGTYTLRYTASTSSGSGTDDMVITVAPEYIRGISVAQSNSSSFSVPKPTGTLNGDPMVAVCNNDFIAATSTGWVRDSAAGQSSFDTAFNIFSKTAGSSEPANYTFDVGASTSATVAIITFNQDLVSPGWDVAPTVDTLSSETTTTAPTAPAITTLVDDAILLTAFGSQEGTSGFSGHTPPSGMTELVDYIPTGTGRSLHITVQIIPTSGSTDNKDSTVLGTAKSYVTQSMSLESILALFINTPSLSSSEAFGVPKTTSTHAFTGIPSNEAFGNAQLDSTYTIAGLEGIGSGEEFGTNTTVSGGIVIIGIGTEEAFGTPELQNNGIGASSIQSGEAFGAPVVLTGAIFIRLDAGIPSEEAFTNPTVHNYGLGPQGIPSAELLNVPTLNVGPVFIEPDGFPSEETFGDVTIHNYGLGPTGIPSEEAFGTLYAFTLIPHVEPIPSAEAFGSPQVNFVIFPSSIESEEVFGSTAGDLPPIVQRQIPQNLISRYEVVCVARIPQTSGPPSFLTIDPITWNDITYEDELNKPQALTVSAKLSSITDNIINRLQNMETLPTEFHVYRNGDLVFAGPLMGWGSTDADTISFSAHGLSAYLGYMGVTSDLLFEDVDQFSMVKSLVDHHQNKEFGHFGIDTTKIGTSGITRSNTFLANELHYVGKKIEDMSGGESGFDFMVDPLTRELKLFHPQQGIDRSDGEDAIIFDSRNVTSFKVDASIAPGDIATEVVGTGQNADNETIISIQSNEELRSKFGRAIYMENFQAGDQATLDSKTLGALNVRANVLLIPGPDTKVTEDSDLSKYGVGDTVSYQVHSRLNVRGAFRLRRRTVSVTSTGKERASFQFA